MSYNTTLCRKRQLLTIMITMSIIGKIYEKRVMLKGGSYAEKTLLYYDPDLLSQ